MVDDEKPEAAADLGPLPSVDFPGQGFPVVFADGVASITRSQPVKMYLYRIDPNMWGKGGTNAIPFAQLVVPRRGFTAMALFFAQQLKLMAKDGSVTKDDAVGYEEEWKALIGE